MKKILVVIITFFILANIFSEGNLIKRTIVVMPIVNNTLDEKNNILCDAMRDIIRSNLVFADQFYLINYSTINEFIGNKKIKDIYDALNFVISIGGDVIIVSELTIENEEFVFKGSVIDGFTAAEKISFSISAEKGMKDIDFIKKATKELTDSIKINFPMISEETLNDMIKNQAVVIEESDPQIIAKLLEQKDKYKKLEVVRNREKKSLAIPFGKNVIVFISEKKDDFTIEYNGVKYRSKKGIKIMAFDSEPKAKREFTIYDIDKNPIKYIYVQKEEYEVIVKKIDANYKGAFVESGIDITSLLYVGINLKAGLSIPYDKGFKDNIYLRTFFGLNINLNYVSNMPFEKNKNILAEEIIHNSNLKLKLGIGYEHVFYLYFKNANNLALHLGGEAGLELHWSNILINSLYMTIIENTNWFLYYPSIYISIPFSFELFPDKKVSLILGLEPVFRVRFNIYVYDWGIYTDEERRKWTENNYEATRGFGWHIWQDLRAGISSFELFFYDAPISVAARFKL